MLSEIELNILRSALDHYINNSSMSKFSTMSDERSLLAKIQKEIDDCTTKK